MTVPLRVCNSCSASIPRGALYCLACGAASPTEGVRSFTAEPAAAERPSQPGFDIEARRALVQAALGDAFQVRALIGRGGFGEVWAAVDSALGRDVAVKVLRPEISANPDFRRRFRREARAIARLRHPGIVPIYHVGEGGGMVWFIMPLVAGVTLRAGLAGPEDISLEEAVRILIEAADALREAHAHGIIHRDIKPENIMLEGPQRRVLLMDFGVAKVEDPGSALEHATEADMVFGSPEYMSPEQATARPLDPRSDVYSLGVVAYRMLTGRLPFAAETPREMLAHHVLSPPVPLTDLAAVPGPIAQVIMKCLAKAPDERWQSAEEFGRALAKALPRGSRLQTPASLLKPAPATAVIAVLIVLILGMWWVLAMRAKRAGPAAARPAGVLQPLAVHASAVRGCLRTTRGDTAVLTDNVPRDNCWFRTDSVAGLGSLAEYAARFRLGRRLAADAGIGLAWCDSANECRIAFLWPRAQTLWGRRSPDRKLSVLSVGSRSNLAAGDHLLSVTFDGAFERCQLDGRQLLLRRAPEEARFLSRPASVSLVVQNTSVELVGGNAITVESPADSHPR